MGAVVYLLAMRTEQMRNRAVPATRLRVSAQQSTVLVTGTHAAAHFLSTLPLANGARVTVGRVDQEPAVTIIVGDASDVETLIRPVVEFLEG